MDTLSRRKLAEYVVSQAKDGSVPSRVIEQVAAYLVEARRTREVELAARAIEDELAARGIVVSDVTTAYALTDEERDEIQRLIGTDTVYFRETVDPGVIGGVQIKTPGKTLDATIASKLQALKRAKL